MATFSESICPYGGRAGPFRPDLPGRRGRVQNGLPLLSRYIRNIDFGTQDHLIADILFGKEKPGGKLPIELPRSQEAANNQKEDIPYDSENPLYNFGHGLEY